MKKSIGQRSVFTFYLLAFIAFNINAQTIRRVTNNPNITGVNIYTTIQAAHDMAIVGDIIYLEPNTLGSYEGLICTKRLTIIGNGFAQFNDNYLTTPNPPLDGRLSTIDGFSMRDGSQNSVIIGVNVAGNYNSIRVPNIKIDRCKSGSIIFEATDISIGLVGRNATITRCAGSNGISTNAQGSIIGSNCVITNNIGFLIANLNNSIIRNNIFPNTITVASSVVTDNIFIISSNIVAVNDYNVPNTNSISNNMAVAANGLPTGNGNINGAMSNSIFITSNIVVGTTPDSGWQLAVGSPAIGTGTSGANMGAFAGASPFVLAGLPPRPIITNFISSGVGNSSTPLSVSITVRGNN